MPKGHAKKPQGGRCLTTAPVYQNCLTQTGLRAELGGQPVVSAVLNGKRAISARQAKALAARFKVSPAAFL